MNILCIYSDIGEPYAKNDPTETLQGSVTVVHNKEDALLMLRDGNFDIILCDLNFPANNADPLTGPYGALFCMWQDIPEYQTWYKVKAIGILVPSHLKETFFYEVPEQELICVTPNNCITIAGQRDWARLLRIVMFRLERAGIQI
ncbi:hypothetical protein H7X65_03650 [Candidatus Parcubacteria bacterium]|nr:hypothetical protein [Candidatus Parcubacteria bacterium]